MSFERVMEITGVGRPRKDDKHLGKVSFVFITQELDRIAFQRQYNAGTKEKPDWKNFKFGEVEGAGCKVRVSDARIMEHDGRHWLAVDVLLPDDVKRDVLLAAGEKLGIKINLDDKRKAS